MPGEATSDARISGKSDELLIACCADCTAWSSDQNRCVTRQRRRFRLPFNLAISIARGTFFTHCAHIWHTGPRYFSPLPPLSFLPLCVARNKCGKSGGGRSEFPYRRDKPARNRCELISIPDALRCISRRTAPGIVFSHPPPAPCTFFLSTSLPIPFYDSLSGFRHRPRRCRFFYGTSSRLSSPFARVLTAARVILPRGQCVTYNWKSRD